MLAKWWQMAVWGRPLYFWCMGWIIQGLQGSHSGSFPLFPSIARLPKWAALTWSENFPAPVRDGFVVIMLSKGRGVLTCQRTHDLPSQLQETARTPFLLYLLPAITSQSRVLFYRPRHSLGNLCWWLETTLASAMFIFLLYLLHNSYKHRWMSPPLFSCL